MPKLSNQKRDKISEQVLHYLFSVAPTPKFTADIAKEMARDEEFIKTLLLELKEKKLVTEVSKNSEGIDYVLRKRWLLTNEAFQAYQRHQPKSF